MVGCVETLLPSGRNQDRSYRMRQTTTMHYTESTIMLYAGLDTECDQQVTVVGRQHLATFTVAKCRQQWTNSCCLFITLSNGECSVAKFSKSKVWDEVQKGSNLIFGDLVDILIFFTTL